MKKVSIILMLLMAFFMPYAANAYNHQVLVGDETSSNFSSYAPFNNNAKYSYAQMIYTAAQINDNGCNYAGYIESISFHVYHSPDVTVPITVYMKTTSKSAFTGVRPWETVTADDIVYDGDVTIDFGANVFEGWFTITFDQPFAYDGTSNLLVAVNDFRGDYWSQAYDTRWTYTTVSGYQVAHANNSSASYDAYNMGSVTGTRIKNLPNIMFNMTLDHPFPTNVTLNDASGSTATISWTAPQTTNTITNYAYEYTNGTTTWNGTTTSTTLNLSNLTAETDYQFQVKAVYSDGESCWSTLDFSSLEDCPTPVNLTASNITSHSAVISWIGSGADSYTLQMGSMGNTASSTETVLSEGFEDGDMPEGWTTTEGWWEVSDIYDAANGIYYAENSNVGESDILITPPMDLSTASSATLNFNFLNVPFDDIFILNVYYRVNGGDWNLLYTDNNEYEDWEPIEINLPGMAANYQIGFECTVGDDWGDSMGIDDVEVVAEMSTITWTTVDDNASKPFTLDNLTPETTYRVRVFSVCGGVPGDPSAPLSFVTLPVPSFTKHIVGYHGNDGGYYLIASPVAEPVTPTAENGFITADYDLYAFDESEELEWRNFEAQAFSQLVSGHGYLYASDEDTDLIFTGEPYSGNGNVTLQKTTNAEFEGWNLVGNPFADSAYLLDHPYYRSNGAAVIDNLENGAIGAMEGVFVIATEDAETLTFTTTRPNSKIARLSVDLTQNNSLLDRVIVRFDEGRQLPKFQLRKNSTKVFIPQEGIDYAVIRSEEIGAMPVNFKAESNGNYTLSFTTEEVNFAYLHLIDNMTGNDVDLLATPSYSFNAKTTDYESRFKLVFATGNNSTDDAFAFFSNGSFVINNEGEATLQVFDINGRLMNSESINGCANIEVNAASGIYMLRLVNGDNVKVQKVVVR